MSVKFIPIKLLIQEPEKEPAVLSFEQKMIKIGRGARKGVDVALDDEKVSRMHATITAKADSASVMSMGSPILVDDKKPKASAKLDNGVVIKIGETTITVYIGETALNFNPLAPPTEEGTIEHPSIEGELPPAHGQYAPQTSGEEQGTLFDHQVIQPQQPAQPFGQMSSPFAAPQTDPNTGFGAQPIGSSGEYEEGGYEIEEEHNLHSSEAHPGIDSAGQGWQQTPNDGSGNFQTHAPSTPAVASNFDSNEIAPSTPPPSSDNMTPNVYPMHTTASIAFGFYGPPPPPLPQQYTGPNPAMLLEVFDRLGKEVWYVQETLW